MSVYTYVQSRTQVIAPTYIITLTDVQPTQTQTQTQTQTKTKTQTQTQTRTQTQTQTQTQTLIQPRTHTYIHAYTYTQAQTQTQTQTKTKTLTQAQTKTRTQTQTKTQIQNKQQPIIKLQQRKRSLSQKLASIKNSIKNKASQYYQYCKNKLLHSYLNKNSSNNHENQTIEGNDNQRDLQFYKSFSWLQNKNTDYLTPPTKEQAKKLKKMEKQLKQTRQKRQKQQSQKKKANINKNQNNYRTNNNDYHKNPYKKYHKDEQYKSSLKQKNSSNQEDKLSISGSQKISDILPNQDDQFNSQQFSADEEFDFVSNSNQLKNNQYPELLDSNKKKFDNQLILNQQKFNKMKNNSKNSSFNKNRNSNFINRDNQNSYLNKNVSNTTKNSSSYQNDAIINTFRREYTDRTRQMLTKSTLQKIIDDQQDGIAFYNPYKHIDQYLKKNKNRQALDQIKKLQKKRQENYNQRKKIQNFSSQINDKQYNLGKRSSNKPLSMQELNNMLIKIRKEQSQKLNNNIMNNQQQNQVQIIQDKQIESKSKEQYSQKNIKDKQEKTSQNKTGFLFNSSFGGNNSLIKGLSFNQNNNSPLFGPTLFSNIKDKKTDQKSKEKQKQKQKQSKSSIASIFAGNSQINNSVPSFIQSKQNKKQQPLNDQQNKKAQLYKEIISFSKLDQNIKSNQESQNKQQPLNIQSTPKEPEKSQNESHQKPPQMSFGKQNQSNNNLNQKKQIQSKQETQVNPFLSTPKKNQNKSENPFIGSASGLKLDQIINAGNGGGGFSPFNNKKQDPFFQGTPSLHGTPRNSAIYNSMFDQSEEPDSVNVSPVNINSVSQPQNQTGNNWVFGASPSHTNSNLNPTNPPILSNLFGGMSNANNNSNNLFGNNTMNFNFQNSTMNLSSNMNSGFGSGLSNLNSQEKSNAINMFMPMQSQQSKSSLFGNDQPDSNAHQPRKDRKSRKRGQQRIGN